MKKYMDNLLHCYKEEKTDIFQLKQRKYGLLNPNKIIYYINESNNILGFFAMYRYWMEYLYFADICGYYPVINVEKDFAYSEDKSVMGMNNAFDYYFEQPAGISIKEVGRSSKVINSNVIHREMVELVLTGKRSHYDCNTRYIKLMGEIVDKYLKFNCITQKYVNESLDKLLVESDHMLGVHVRGTDFRKKYNNHPVFVSEKDCFNAIEVMLNQNKYNKIFVATDDQNILDAFIREYGDIICYYKDVVRSSDLKSVAFHTNERKSHKYKLGLEVIRDMYTLSICSGLVAGISQVAICARINKVSRKEKYENVTIIDKGIYRNGHNLYRHY